MGFVDFILNLAGLLLWLNWRTSEADPFHKRKPATLIGTLRRAEPASAWRRWQVPAILAGLLLLRAVFYWQIGSAAHWSATLRLGVTTLYFRSELFRLTLLFSICSFVLTLAVFYLWLVLFSILAGPEPFHGHVRMHLGRIDRWSRGMKAALPLIAGAALWWLASWLFTWLQIIPHPASELRRTTESLVIGLGGYLAWQYAIGVLLVLHLLNTYVYFGKNPFWNYVNATAKTLLQPLRKIPLRAGRVDLAPVAGIVLTFLLAGLAERLLVFLYGRLSS
jgi:uncharacterized protein YggT (Ycf19 family)